MTTLLANLTGALFAEMHLAMQTGRLTPKLDAALLAYIAYWKKTGGSADAVVDFVRRLLARARQADAGSAHLASAGPSRRADRRAQHEDLCRGEEGLSASAAGVITLTGGPM